MKTKFEDFITTGKKLPEDEFIGLLMASASYFHSAHFETKSYARHKAYNFFFDTIPELTDKFGEQWLGWSGKKYTPSIPSQQDLPTDTIEMLDSITAKAESIYDKMPGAIRNTIDEINGIVFQTKYLLSLE